MKTSLGMNSLIVLVMIQSFALSRSLGGSAGLENRSDGSRKGSSGEAGQQGSEQQHKHVAAQRINRDATVTSVKQSHQVRKRLCWLEAKLRRTVMLWCAVIGEARACYGAQDGGEWRLLESQMEQHLAQNEQFWEGAVDDCRYIS